MLQFIETICYENGSFQNLLLHEERMNRTRLHFFGLQNKLSLADLYEAVPDLLPSAVLPSAVPDLLPSAVPDLLPSAVPDLLPSSVLHSAVPDLLPSAVPDLLPSAVPDLQSGTNPPHAKKIKCRLTYSATIQTIEFEPYTPKVIRSLQLIYDNTIDYNFKYKDRTALDALLSKRGTADEILIVKNGLITDTSYSNIVFLRDGKWYTPQAPLLPGTRRADYLHRKLIFPLEISPEDLGQFKEARLINAMLSLEEATPIAIEGIYP